MDRALRKMHMRSQNPFLQYAWLMLRHGGNLRDALAQAAAQIPAAEDVLKAAVAAGTTGDVDWAATVPGYRDSFVADFVQLIDARSILGKLNASRVPFRVPIISADGSGTHRTVRSDRHPGASS